MLSIGPTPLIDMRTWSLEVSVEDRVLKRFSWDEFQALEQSNHECDIHCVTRWSRFDTKWSGVMMDSLLRAVGLEQVPHYLSAISLDGYSTNVPTVDLVGGRSMIATHYNGDPLTRHHGGPARLLVPHLYFWKSAKWVNELRFTHEAVPGFWETRGYHIYGDPWLEKRFDGE